MSRNSVNVKRGAIVLCILTGLAILLVRRDMARARSVSPNTAAQVGNKSTADSHTRSSGRAMYVGPHTFSPAYEYCYVDTDGRPVMMETANGSQPVEVRGEFTVSQPEGIPEGSPIDVALAVNLGPIPLPAGTRFVWRLMIDGEALPGASLGFTTRPARQVAE